MRRSAVTLLVLGPVLAAALAASVVAYAAYGGDLVFIRQQEHAQPARAVDLEHTMLTTPEPYEGHVRDATDATCSPGGGGELQNPWVCRLRYRSGRRATFRVQLRTDGSFVADHREGTGSITGCCVELSAGM